MYRLTQPEIAVLGVIQDCPGLSRKSDEKLHCFIRLLAYMSGSLNPINFMPVGHEGAALVQGLRSVRGILN